MNVIYKSPGTITNEVGSLINISEEEISKPYTAKDMSPPLGHELYTPPYDEMTTPEISPNPLNNYPGIDNISGDLIVSNLKKVMTNCIDPIIRNSPFRNQELVIKSAYRSKRVNQTIGGTTENNEHILGQAIDFYIDGYDTDLVREWCYYNIESYNNLLLVYPENQKNSWIHISYISEEDNLYTFTLVSRDEDIHNKYNGDRRIDNTIYQDNIKLN